MGIYKYQDHYPIDTGPSKKKNIITATENPKIKDAITTTTETSKKENTTNTDHPKKKDATIKKRKFQRRRRLPSPLFHTNTTTHLVAIHDTVKVDYSEGWSLCRVTKVHPGSSGKRKKILTLCLLEEDGVEDVVEYDEIRVVLVSRSNITSTSVEDTK